MSLGYSYSVRKDHERTKVFPVGPYEIGELVDRHFWDTVFLLAASMVEGLGLQGRQGLGASPEAFGIAQQFVPHDEEL